MFFWLSIITLMLSFSVNAACNKALKTGWSTMWEPLVMGSYDKPSGFDKDILQATIDAAGCQLQQAKTIIPWARQLIYIRTGQLDIITGASKTKERIEYAYFTTPYRREFVTLFVMAEDLHSLEADSIDDWIQNDVVLGVEYGNFYGEAVRNILKTYPEKVHEVIKNEQNIQKLLNGRIDGYIGYIPAEVVRLNKLGLKRKIVAVQQFKINTGEVSFMLSKESTSKEVLEAINQGLLEIRSNGIYDRILKKYTDKYGTIQ